MTTVRCTISEATMSDAAKVPYQGERGRDAAFEYAIRIDGVTRLFGAFSALATPFKSDGALLKRPPGPGGATGGSPFDAVDLAIYANETVAVSIAEGAAVLAALFALAGRLDAERARAIAAEATKFDKAGGALSGDLDMAGHRLRGLAAPMAAGDAVRSQDLIDALALNAGNDVENAQALSALIYAVRDALNARVSTETDARLSADFIEQTARVDTDNLLSGQITQEVQDRIAAIRQEQLDRNAAILAEIARVIDAAPGMLDTPQ